MMLRLVGATVAQLARYPGSVVVVVGQHV